MKKLVLNLALIASIFASCNSEDDETTTVITPVVGEISGDITSDKVLEKGTYTLKGTVTVKDGATLTIKAGSVITSDATDGTDVLIVEKTGKVNFTGSAAEPIVFTDKSKTNGSWGGIILFGDAPLVSGKDANGNPITTATSEDGTNKVYGGTVANHSNGTMKYVRVEYAGKKILDGNSEMNGFSFYAVGSGTILENLVAYKGADDGFEFYGGTVSAKNLISYGNTDDSFDWQDGWRGEANSNWYAFQTGAGNYGMEIESKGVNNSFFPKVANITLRRDANTGPETAGSVEFDAIQFKKEGNGEYSNIVISGYSNSTSTVSAVAVRIQDAGTNTNQVAGGKIKILGLKIEGDTPSFGAGTTSIKVDFPTANFTINSTSTGAALTKGAWSTIDSVDLLAKL